MRKAERNGIRGKRLVKVFKRAQKSPDPHSFGRTVMLFRQPSVKVANMSVYEILTIVLIAVLATAATAAIYLGLLNWIGRSSSSGAQHVTT